MLVKQKVCAVSPMGMVHAIKKTSDSLQLLYRVFWRKMSTFNGQTFLLFCFFFLSSSSCRGEDECANFAWHSCQLTSSVCQINEKLLAPSLTSRFQFITEGERKEEKGHRTFMWNQLYLNIWKSRKKFIELLVPLQCVIIAKDLKKGRKWGQIQKQLKIHGGIRRHIESLVKAF